MSASGRPQPRRGNPSQEDGFTGNAAGSSWAPSSGSREMATRNRDSGRFEKLDEPTSPREHQKPSRPSRFTARALFALTALMILGVLAVVASGRVGEEGIGLVGRGKKKRLRMQSGPVHESDVEEPEDEEEEVDEKDKDEEEQHEKEDQEEAEASEDTADQKTEEERQEESRLRRIADPEAAKTIPVDSDVSRKDGNRPESLGLGVEQRAVHRESAQLSPGPGAEGDEPPGPAEGAEAEKAEEETEKEDQQDAVVEDDEVADRREDGADDEDKRSANREEESDDERESDDVGAGARTSERDQEFGAVATASQGADEPSTAADESASIVGAIRPQGGSPPADAGHAEAGDRLSVAQRRANSDAYLGSEELPTALPVAQEPTPVTASTTLPARTAGDDATGGVHAEVQGRQIEPIEASTEVAVQPSAPVSSEPGSIRSEAAASIGAVDVVSAHKAEDGGNNVQSALYSGAEELPVKTLAPPAPSMATPAPSMATLHDEMYAGVEELPVSKSAGAGEAVLPAAASTDSPAKPATGHSEEVGAVLQEAQPASQALPPDGASKTAAGASDVGVVGGKSSGDAGISAGAASSSSSDVESRVAQAEMAFSGVEELPTKGPAPKTLAADVPVAQAQEASGVGAIRAEGAVAPAPAAKAAPASATQTKAPHVQVAGTAHVESSGGSAAAAAATVGSISVQTQNPQEAAVQQASAASVGAISAEPRVPQEADAGVGAVHAQQTGSHEGVSASSGSDVAVKSGGLQEATTSTTRMVATQRDSSISKEASASAQVASDVVGAVRADPSGASQVGGAPTESKATTIPAAASVAHNEATVAQQATVSTTRVGAPARSEPGVSQEVAASAASVHIARSEAAETVPETAGASIGAIRAEPSISQASAIGVGAVRNEADVPTPAGREASSSGGLAPGI